MVENIKPYNLNLEHMKNFRIQAFTVIAILSAAFASAQTADEIIGKYINAIGGKDQVSQVSSVYTESKLDVTGYQGTLKTTLLNGKGYKEEIDITGTQVIFCFTDSTGWQINPVAGNYGAELMTPSQYATGKGRIILGWPVIDCSANGYKVELLGQETIGDVNAHKLRVLSAEGAELMYYFEPETGYLIRIVQKAEMMGQPMDIVHTFAKYQKTDSGVFLPYHTETNYGGQYFLVSDVTLVEINKAIDPIIFTKP